MSLVSKPDNRVEEFSFFEHTVNTTDVVPGTKQKGFIYDVPIEEWWTTGVSGGIIAPANGQRVDGNKTRVRFLRKLELIPEIYTTTLAAYGPGHIRVSWRLMGPHTTNKPGSETDIFTQFYRDYSYYDYDWYAASGAGFELPAGAGYASAYSLNGEAVMVDVNQYFPHAWFGSWLALDYSTLGVDTLSLRVVITVKMYWEWHYVEPLRYQQIYAEALARYSSVPVATPGVKSFRYILPGPAHPSGGAH